jgi:hypothetical protein
VEKVAKPKEVGGWGLKNAYMFIVKWEKVAKPKEVGGWGLKNAYMFGKLLQQNICGN